MNSVNVVKHDIVIVYSLNKVKPGKKKGVSSNRCPSTAEIS